jgi:hypothetical protein
VSGVTDRAAAALKEYLTVHESALTFSAVSFEIAAGDDAQRRPDSRLEAAYHRADAAIQKVIDLLAAA